MIFKETVKKVMVTINTNDGQLIILKKCRIQQKLQVKQRDAYPFFFFFLFHVDFVIIC